jgi:hypothetical protein
MKRVVIGICLALAIVATANLFPGRAQQVRGAGDATNNGGQAVAKNWAAGNPQKIALLKWYQANLVPTSFAVGKTQNSNPYGIAFDGANIWTANSEGTVTKLRASDGASLGTFPAGNAPTGIAFDGANMWVTNYYDGTVTKLRASDGRSLGTFSLGQGTYPFWLAFDGENMWIADGLGVTKLRDVFAPDGAVVCGSSCPHPYSLSDFFNFGGSPTAFAPFTPQEGVNYITQCFITPKTQSCFGTNFKATDPDADAVDE